MIKEAQMLGSKALTLPCSCHSSSFVPLIEAHYLRKHLTKNNIFAVPAVLNYIPERAVLVVSCHFPKTRAEEKRTAHRRVTFQMSSSGPNCTDRIADKKLNSFVVLKLIGLYLSSPIFCWLYHRQGWGETHYSLVLFRSYYSGNLLVFLLLSCWVCSRKSKRC